MTKSTQKFLIVLTGAFFALLGYQSASAETTSVLPEPVVGQTQVTSPGGQKYYGGQGGNEAILNYQPDFLHGFEKANMLNCSDKIGLPELICQALTVKTSDGSTNSTTIRSLSSRTYRDGVAEIEVSALLYPENLIVGDVYGFNNPNFAYSYLGSNLRLTPDNSYSNAFWNLPGYGFNRQAQAYWDAGNASKNATLDQTINRLVLNAKSLKNNIFDGYFTWVKKSFDGVCGSLNAACAETNQYPEGRVWYSSYYDSESDYGAYLTGASVSYKRKSTFIIEKGDAIIQAGMLPADDNSAFGMIIRNGDLYFQNPSGKEMVIRGNFFVPNGTIRIDGSNIKMIGSFVARDFAVANPAATTNISFIYDKRLEEIWPPGFRDLKIPSMLVK